MIAGRRCYQGTTLHELRREHVATVAKPLHEVVPNVPKGFSEAIQRATAKDRADRQPSAAVLAAELKAGLTTAAAGIQPSIEFAKTLSKPGKAQTNSDVNAPTVIGLDASVTSVPDTAPVTSAPQPAERVVNTPIDPSMSAPTVVESAGSASTVVEHAVSQSPSFGSDVTVAREPKAVVPDIAPAPKSKGKSGLVIGVIVLMVFLVVAAVAGYFIYAKLKPAPTTSTNTNTVATTPMNTVKEVSRYWLMLEPASAKEAPTRVAGLVPIASGQSFQMRFVFPENGYLYIVGPGGDNNEPTAFLTTKPAPQTGLTSNAVNGGSEFSFPSGDGLLRLDTKPGTDKFTVIFSKTKLESPSFLSSKVDGKPMSADRLSEFNDFVSKRMQKAPVTELDDTNNQLPFVRVKVDAEQVGNPIVFEIRIQHN